MALPHRPQRGRVPSAPAAIERRGHRRGAGGAGEPREPGGRPGAGGRAHGRSPRPHRAPARGADPARGERSVPRRDRARPRGVGGRGEAGDLRGALRRARVRRRAERGLRHHPPRPVRRRPARASRPARPRASAELLGLPRVQRGRRRAPAQAGRAAPAAPAGPGGAPRPDRRHCDLLGDRRPARRLRSGQGRGRIAARQGRGGGRPGGHGHRRRGRGGPGHAPGLAPSPNLCRGGGCRPPRPSPRGAPAPRSAPGPSRRRRRGACPELRPGPADGPITRSGRTTYPGCRHITGTPTTANRRAPPSRSTASMVAITPATAAATP